MTRLSLPPLPRVPPRLQAPLRWVGYPVFAVAVFQFALYHTLPRERIQEQVLAATSDWLNADVEVERFGLVGLPAPGFAGHGVTVTARAIPGVAPPVGSDGKPEKPPRYLVDDVTVRFDPFQLLRGMTDTSFDGRVAGGRVVGKYHSRPDEGHVEAEATGLQLKSFAGLPALLGIAGVPIEGALTLKGEVTAAQNVIEQTEGEIVLAIEGARLGDGKGKLVAASVPLLAGGLTVPPISFGRIEGSVSITHGRAQLRDVKAHSPDLDLAVEGYIELHTPPTPWTLNLYVTIKPSEALLKREAALEPIPLLGGQARRPDGYYGIAISGTTLMPQAMPSPFAPPGLNVKPAPPPKGGLARPALAPRAPIVPPSTSGASPLIPSPPIAIPPPSTNTAEAPPPPPIVAPPPAPPPPPPGPPPGAAPVIGDAPLTIPPPPGKFGTGRHAAGSATAVPIAPHAVEQPLEFPPEPAARE